MKQPDPVPRQRRRKRTMTVEGALETLENERRYVARELHDGVAQTTLQLGLQAGICRKLLERGNLDMLGQELAALEARVQLASTQVREVIAEMRPPRLEPDASLQEHLKTAIDTHIERGGAWLEFQDNLRGHLPFSPAQKLTLTRIVQEALLNVRKHAQATNIRLSLSEDAHYVYVTIADNGRGFEPPPQPARSVDRGGAGLANLQARARALGGRLTIARGTGGQGTEMKVVVPKKFIGQI
ncbi:MAG: sensor histidine kinase [Anaerolineae bacterium]|nr:sensor histidine kinase [Anaerolineae bacterium]